ncbi:hypothetical protein PR1_83 [Providencia phage vB_PreS_PR1]|uniref:Uncharacterized protein n=1 Tax=Providencia phage vB_PreS_PR1 TaxID=1931407 RepID=A0A1S6KUV5_9CAUD|nr:hypothetical protein FDH30_gp132 [Providencia phage vB_PreS_PR1]AQT25223.1 hypothetical protein PR1_83 [Providencia phage vB_PreS_PR1]
MYFIILFACSLFVVATSNIFFRHKISRKELLIQLGVAAFSSLLMLGMAVFAASSGKWDTEIRNGYVTKKYSERVSCEHQYKCGETCSTDSKGNRTCIPIYCDEHSYDVDWIVESTIDYSKISRVDRRGLKEPPRWSAAVVNEPYSATFSVNNYTRLDKGMYVVEDATLEKYADSLPDYPRVYDYYRINRIVGKYAPDINNFLNEKLRLDGSTYQLNITLVVTQAGEDFFDALMHKWHGGKKNDVVIVYSLDDDNKVKWLRANTLGNGQDNQLLLTKLAATGLGSPEFNLSLVQTQYDLIVKHYKRLPNDTFKYLDDVVDIPTGALIFVIVLNFIANIGFAIFCIKEDL